MRIFFVTSNEAKFREASLVLKEFGIDLMIDKNHRKIEIQSDNLEDIVSNALQGICIDNSSDYFVVEDDGLFINRLNGFPGPYSSYVYKTIGLTGILKLMSGGLMIGQPTLSPWLVYAVLRPVLNCFQVLYMVELRWSLGGVRRGGSALIQYSYQMVMTRPLLNWALTLKISYPIGPGHLGRWVIGY